MYCISKAQSLQYDRNQIIKLKKSKAFIKLLMNLSKSATLIDLRKISYFLFKKLTKTAKRPLSTAVTQK